MALQGTPLGVVSGGARAVAVSAVAVSAVAVSAAALLHL